MQILETLITRISRLLDFTAGLILAVTAALIVANILARALLNTPILGTYEMVGFFTAGAVGLALARCALENSHIAVEFIMDRFPQPLQKVVQLVTGIPVIGFIIFTAYNLFLYGARIAESGEVSATTQMAFYPFIYMVALGFLALSLVLVLKLLQLFMGGEQR